MMRYWDDLLKQHLMKGKFFIPIFRSNHTELFCKKGVLQISGQTILTDFPFI